MARSRVSFLVGTTALVVAVLSLPDQLEGQTTGVLQATVRVVDYRASLSALKGAQAAAERTIVMRQTSPHAGPSAPSPLGIVAHTRSSQVPQGTVTVTIYYLCGQARIE